MKNFYLLLFTATILISCNKHKYVNNPMGNPAEGAPSSLNIRVQNGLSIQVINASIQDVRFGDLEPGAASSFRNISTSLGNATCSFSINGKAVTAKSGNHACGDGSSAASGNYTFMIIETLPGSYSLSVSKY